MHLLTAITNHLTYFLPATSASPPHLFGPVARFAYNVRKLSTGLFLFLSAHLAYEVLTLAASPVVDTATPVVPIVFYQFLYKCAL